MSSSGPENCLRRAIHAKLAGVYQCKMNHQFHAGVADDWYSGNKADIWIEWKFEEPLKTKPLDLTGGKNPIISHLQQDWLRSRHAEGRSVAVIVGCKAGCVILPGLSWEAPIENMNEIAVLRPTVVRWIEQQTKKGRQ